MSFLTLKQKIATTALMVIATVNQYTLPGSYADFWWTTLEKDQYYQKFSNSQSPVINGIIAGLQIGSPLCKTYCYFFFPLLFCINMILLATSKEDKALGMCKTALITEIIVLLLMIFLPQLILAAINAGGTSI